MARIIKLLIFVLVVAFAITEGWPRLKRQLEGHSRRPLSSLQAVDSGSGAESECLRLANQASDMLGDGLSSYISPPFDLAQWERFSDSVKQAGRDAAYACNCSHDACGLAVEAMNELDSLILDMDSMLRDKSKFADPSNRHAKVYDLLNEARSSLSAG